MIFKTAKYGIGQVVRHRLFHFRGVVFDADSEFSGSEEWYKAIPEAIRPDRNQPFYHIFAENDEGSYVAYVSEQNLEADESGMPLDNPQISQLFGVFNPKSGLYNANRLSN